MLSPERACAPIPAQEEEKPDLEGSGYPSRAVIPLRVSRGPAQPFTGALGVHSLESSPSVLESGIGSGVTLCLRYIQHGAQHKGL